MDLTEFVDSITPKGANTASEIIENYGVLDISQTIYFIISMIFVMTILLRLKEYAENPDKYRDGTLFACIISFIMLITSQTVIFEVLPHITTDPIFQFLIPYAFLSTIIIFFRGGASTIPTPDFVNRFDTKAQLIEYLETKNNQNRIQLINRHKKSILNKFPDMENNPLFKTKTEKLVIIEDEH